MCSICHQMFESTLELSPGDSALFINGIRTDLEMDDVFQVLDVLRSEACLMDGLHSLGIKVIVGPVGQSPLAWLRGIVSLSQYQGNRRTCWSISIGLVTWYSLTQSVSR